MRQLPGVTLSDDVLTKTEQEVTASLEKSKEEENVTKGGEDAAAILRELEDL